MNAIRSLTSTSKDVVLAGTELESPAGAAGGKIDGDGTLYNSLRKINTVDTEVKFVPVKHQRVTTGEHLNVAGDIPEKAKGKVAAIGHL